MIWAEVRPLIKPLPTWDLDLDLDVNLLNFSFIYCPKFDKAFLLLYCKTWTPMPSLGPVWNMTWYQVNLRTRDLDVKNMVLEMQTKRCVKKIRQTCKPQDRRMVQNSRGPAVPSCNRGFTWRRNATFTSTKNWMAGKFPLSLALASPVPPALNGMALWIVKF